MTVQLAGLEAEVAARCGPFELRLAAAATATTVVVDALRSTIALGGYTDRYLLRRLATVPDDRTRRVAAYDPATGTLTVDRAWATPPVVGEAVELMILDPDTELRPAVLRGLRRCFFVERAAVEATPGQVAEALSAALWWITDVGQIRDVEAGVGTGHGLPLRWYRLLSSSAPTAAPEAGGLRVTAEVSGLGSPSAVYVVEALRPYGTLVDGADAPNGPQTDAAVLACPVGYAAALGHAEAWRRCAATLGPIARAGYAEGRETAMREVTHQARAQWWYWDRPDRIRLGDPDAGREAWPTWRTVDRDYTWHTLEPRIWRAVMERAA